VCFFAAKLKSTILCALLDHLSEQNWLPDEFSQKMFPITPPGNGNVGLGLETFQSSVLKSVKIRRRRKKLPVKFRQKIKTTFLGHEFFLLFKLKLQYFVQESAAKFTIFYLL
jgi:hypothetical protein